ncbi:MAG: S49 family peptidase, partial [candidate division Zixibacteria bacterium]|nr:S49 family peptidase [candidate division Zixibacteria bacterium]
GMTAAEIKTLVDRGPFLGKEALEAGLVDGMAYRDEVYAKVKEGADKNAELLYLNSYLERAGRPHQSGEKVALIYGVGDVLRGKSSYDPVFGSPTMGAATVAKAFRDAIVDDDVKAILFRVDSPGGSYVASDVIWREVIRAREAGKPVIVTMGDVAASGGYFVSMHADKIVARPATITASIGVLGGKMYTAGFWNKLGINWDEIHFGQNATIWSGSQDYTESEMARGNAMLDRIYEDFTSKVAKGRSLPLDSVLKIARGRVWSGVDALQIGLVDELGGFPTAVRLVKEALQVPENEDIKLVLFPKEKSLLDIITGEEPESSESEAMVTAAMRTLRTVQPYLRMAAEAGLIEERQVLRMPALELNE